MVKKINRQELLQTLEAVSPGLAAREAVEQSSCFIFRDGMVMTFNEEIGCAAPCDIGITGAVVGKKLVEILGKLVEEDLEVELVEGGVLFKKGRRRLQVNMEDKIVLPIESIEAAEKWRPIPEDMVDAIITAQQCTVRQHENFCLTCVHIAPLFIEGTDNFQIARYPVATGLKKPTLVKGESAKHLLNVGAIEYTVTPNWLHFRNGNGLQYSCRRYNEVYPNTEPFLEDTSGGDVQLPGGLAEAVEKAQVFSSENVNNDNITISLKQGKGLRIKGEGSSGWFEETKDADYKGPPIKFHIAPKLLIDLTKKHTRCKVNENRLLVDNGKFKYITSLADPDQ